MAVLPIVVAAVRAIVQHWRPIGDNALVALRAHDVLTSHQPLLGTWSSASLEAGTNLNHPGPLLFESVALPVKLLGSNAPMIDALQVLGGREAGELPKNMAASGISGGIGSLFSSHPPLEARIAALRQAA